jgi:hypothetical protein
MFAGQPQSLLPSGAVDPPRCSLFEPYAKRSLNAIDCIFFVMLY